MLGLGFLRWCKFYRRMLLFLGFGGRRGLGGNLVEVVIMYRERKVLIIFIGLRECMYVNSSSKKYFWYWYL